MKANCHEGFDCNAGKDLPEIIRKSKVVPPDQDWEFITKMTMVIRDILYGNPKLDEMGWHEEALGKQRRGRRIPGAAELDGLAAQRGFLRSHHGLHL